MILPQGQRGKTNFEGKDRRMEDQLLNAIRSDLRAFKDELVKDIKELAEKIDNVNKDKNLLEKDFFVHQATIEARMGEFNRDIDTLRAHIRELRERQAKSESIINTHEIEHKTKESQKKGVAEWVRWLPGVIFGLVALYLSVAK